MATATVPKTKIAGGSFLIEDRRPEEVFTPEDFTDEHRQIAQTTEEFALKEIVPNIEKIEHKDFSVTRDLIKKASELGLTSVDIPEEYGGMEMDKVTSAIIADPPAMRRPVSCRAGPSNAPVSSAHRRPPSACRSRHAWRARCRP